VLLLLLWQPVLLKRGAFCMGGCLWCSLEDLLGFSKAQHYQPWTRQQVPSGGLELFGWSPARASCRLAHVCGAGC